VDGQIYDISHATAIPYTKPPEEPVFSILEFSAAVDITNRSV
jgi:hypothetical protein